MLSAGTPSKHTLLMDCDEQYLSSLNPSSQSGGMVLLEVYGRDTCNVSRRLHFGVPADVTKVGRLARAIGSQYHKALS